MIRLARWAGAMVLLALALATPGTARAQTEINVCSGQVVPPGYVVVRAYRGEQCPNYYAGTHNAVTIRLPGDTATVCSSLSSMPSGYVVTGQFRSEACPNYYGPLNAARWQRLPTAEPPRPRPDAEEPQSMLALDDYGRHVQRRMRAMEARFRLAEATHDPWTDAGPQGSVVRRGFNRKEGEPLTLVAACDQDCAAMQLRVLSPSGAVVATGEAGPESSVWLGAPQALGTWTVEVAVRTCRAEFCRFAVGIYQTPADVPPLSPRRPPLRPSRP